MKRLPLLLLPVLFVPLPAQAAALDGAVLAWPWALPFGGILLTIATGPLLFARIWHHHYGKFAVAWSAAILVPLAIVFGAPAAGAALVHTLLAEYMSFIVLLFALYVVSGGILITGTLPGTPAINIAILAIGTLIASVVGTTGAAMILIRPLIRANEARIRKTHIVVFFIFLVANIGGSLSPLGDPPLFVGFLHGVDFFWTTTHLWRPTLFVAGAVLAIFIAIELVLYRRDRPDMLDPPRLRVRLHASGLVNLVLIALIVAVILLTASWQPDFAFDVFGTKLELQNLTRDILLVVIAIASLVITPDEHRAANGFSFEPIREVAILFGGIFVCVIPVLAMLQAGHDGAFGLLLTAVTAHDGTPHEGAYFWLTGALSAFLDNAPTYLVFFQLAGGNVRELMTTLGPTLTAISMGAVYMGALTYIGNAPNFMIYAIATERGVPMPSFFGYLLWSVPVLVPVFAIVTWFWVM